MDFMRLLKSFEELLYEVVSWLIFYPLTLWRSITRPFRMMHYADAELDDRLEERFADMLSPPLFLLISLLIAHGAELILLERQGRDALPDILNSDSNLLIARAMLFSVFPLAMAATLLLARGSQFNRETLRAPFYSQGYVAAPFILCVSMGTNLMRMSNETVFRLGAGLSIAAVLWYGTVQIIAFKRDLGIGWMRSAALVVASLLAAILIIVTAAVLLTLDAKSWAA